MNKNILQIIILTLFSGTIPTLCTGHTITSPHYTETIIPRNKKEVKDLLEKDTYKDNYKVRKTLIEIGFKEHTIQTPTGYTLRALIRKGDKNKPAIIFNSGFFPGVLEGMATFVPFFFEQGYTIILFQQRYRESSIQDRYNLLSSLPSLPVEASKDLLYVIDDIENQNIISKTCPIVLFGACFGAITILHALPEIIKKEGLRERVSCIFDSSVPHLSQLSYTAIMSMVDKMCAKLPFLLKHAIWAAGKGLWFVLYHVYFKNVYKKLDETLDLPTIYSTIKITHIHHEKDEFAKLSDLEDILKKYGLKPQCFRVNWEIKNPHANMHVAKIAQQEYQNIITQILGQIPDRSEQITTTSHPKQHVVHTDLKKIAYMAS